MRLCVLLDLRARQVDLYCAIFFVTLRRETAIRMYIVPNGCKLSAFCTLIILFGASARLK